MACYAILDFNGKVELVIPGEESNLMDWEQFYSMKFEKPCKKTYSECDENGLIKRKNFAGVGFTYDYEKDAFIPPKPELGEWILNEETCQWVEID